MEVESDVEDVDGTLTAEAKVKLDTSGGTTGTETVGVGGVLASDRTVLLPSVCLEATLATGIDAAAALFPVV